jgi:hypothetical protein
MYGNLSETEEVVDIWDDDEKYKLYIPTKVNGYVARNGTIQ